MKTNCLALGVCCLALGLAGCVGTLDGHHQAGWPFKNDTVERRFERPMDAVWKAAKDTLAYNGVVTVENVAGHTLTAKVDTRTVYALVESLAPNLTRVLVQVRTKGGGTDIDLAAHLQEQIAVRLATGNLMPATAPPPPAGSAPRSR